MTPQIKDNEIIVALIALIKSITTVGGNYFFTYTDVKDNPSAPMEEGIAIVDGDEVETGEDSSGVFHYMRKTVYIRVIDRNGKMEIVRKKVADIEKIIGNNLTISGTAINTIYKGTSGEIVNQEGDLICNKQIEIEIFYRKNAWGIQ